MAIRTVVTSHCAYISVVALGSRPSLAEFEIIGRIVMCWLLERSEAKSV